MLARVIARLQESGDVVAGEPRRIARALRLATDSFLPCALTPEELGDAKRLREESGDVIDIVVDGISVRRTESTTSTSTRTTDESERRA